MRSKCDKKTNKCEKKGNRFKLITIKVNLGKWNGLPMFLQDWGS